MPVDLHTLGLFAGASIVLILAPGPDILFLITQGIANGRIAGVATALGLSLGNSVHTIGVALGLSAVFRTSATAFDLLKGLGAAYLFYLAYQAIRHRDAGLTLGSGAARLSPRQLIARGFLMNVMNPKVALFFLAFLPQFVKLHGASVPLQVLTLGGVFMALVAVIFGALGFFAGSAGEWLGTKKGISRWINLVSALIFIALGLKLVFLQHA